MNQQRSFTAVQHGIIQELTNAHGLEISQIGFEGDDTTPIFDFEAVCLLSLKLTDIQEIRCEITDRDADSEIVTARCSVTLPDSRMRVCEDSAKLGEIIGDGKTIDTMRFADMVAQSRAVRRGIRSVGINLFHAHNRFMRDGQTVQGHTNHDPRHPLYQEVHVLASELDLIDGTDKTLYRQFLAESYDGRQSSKDLDDVELQRFLISLRAMARVKRLSKPRAA